MCIVYDIDKRIDIAENRAQSGTNLEERLYFLDAADNLRIRKHEKEIIEALREVEKYPTASAFSQ